MTRKELQKLMAKTFGKDWENKVFIGPTCVFRLRDVYEECGMNPPGVIEHNSGGFGLWQPWSST